MSIKIFKALLLTAMAFVLLAFVFMQLWNFVIPKVFSLPELSFLQSQAIIIMNRILFAGWGTSFFRKSQGDIHEASPGNRHRSPVGKFRSTWEDLCTRETVETVQKEEQDTF